MEPGIVAPSSWLYDVWNIVLPIVVTVATPIATVIAGWLALKLSLLLSKNDEVARLKIEGELKNALHQSAENALKYAISKRTGPLVDMIAGTVPKGVIADAIAYVHDKNPDAAVRLGVDDASLTQIILSKVPTVQAVIAAASQAKPPAVVKAPAKAAPK